MGEDQVRKVAAEIQAYLDAHPQAMDSADGVLKWWLARQRIEESKLTVEQALEYLVSRDLVRRRVLAGGNVVYGRTDVGQAIK